MEVGGVTYRALPEVLAPEQAAAMLGTTSRQLVKMAVAGTAPATKMGRLWRFSKTRLEEYMRG